MRYSTGVAMTICSHAQVFEAADETLKEEDAVKERLCSELNMLVQQSAHAQLEKLEQVQRCSAHVPADRPASTAMVALASRSGRQLVPCMPTHATHWHLLHSVSPQWDAWRPLNFRIRRRVSITCSGWPQSSAEHCLASLPQLMEELSICACGAVGGSRVALQSSDLLSRLYRICVEASC